ncbi:protein Syg1p [Monosporozyma servazzii]
MKFADHLTESAIPEWKDKYLDYKLGKKKLKYQYGKFPKDPLRSISTSKLSTMSRNKSSFSIASDIARLSASASSKSPYHRDMSNENLNNTDMYTSFQLQAIKQFIERWLIGEEMAKCNDFYQWLLKEASKKFSILQGQLQIYDLQRETYLNEFVNGSTYNNDDDDIIYTTNTDQSTYNNTANDQMSSIITAGPQQDGMYGSISNVNSIDAKRINTDDISFKSKVKEFLKQNMLWPSWPDKTTQWRDMIVRKNAELPYSGNDDTTSNINAGIDTVKETFAYDNIAQNSEITIRKAQLLLGDALLEYYLYLQMIKTFRDTNVTGFRKMVKKFDKTLQTKELDKFMKYAKDNYSLFKHVAVNIQLLAQQMQENNTNQPTTDLTVTNPKDDPILWWETKVKDWYINELTNSPTEVKKHSKTLKKFIVGYTLTEEIIHRNNRSITQMSTASLFLGVSIALFIYTLSLSFTSNPASYTHKILFPLWGGWFMVLLMMLLFQVNCFIWHRTSINYRFIMLGETQTRNGTKLFNNDFATSGIPLQLYTCMYFILWVSICAGFSYKFEKLIPWAYICFGGSVLLFVLPKNSIPYWDKIISTRRWLLIRTIRLMCAPLFPVEFGDFFVGDIICSLTYSMSDLAMFSCLVATDEKGLCGSSHSKAMGVLACLPSYWRMVQCLRRYADSGDKFPHLLNAAKYSFGIFYNASLCAYRLANHAPSARTPFIILALINAAVTAAWDIVIDWSLFQPSRHNLFLRDDLYLAGKKNWKDGTYEGKRKLVYYAAMIWDVLIRFQWVVWAVAPSTIQQNAVTSFFVAFVEVLRRFVWIIFRVENEHVANVHLFKVSSDAPLPYPVVFNPDIDIEMNNNFISDDQSFKSSVSFNGNLEDQNVAEPSSTYHSMVRRRASMFDGISRVIPWAHATDFQRPAINIENERRESDSDTEI